MNTEESEIIERGGKLYVIESWHNHFSKPIKYRTAWPTGLFASEYPDLIGKKCKLNGFGIARMDDGLCLRLEHGAETKPSPENSEERMIPRPAWAHEYRNGRYVR